MQMKKNREENYKKIKSEKNKIKNKIKNKLKINKLFLYTTSNFFHLFKFFI